MKQRAARDVLCSIVVTMADLFCVVCMHTRVLVCVCACVRALDPPISTLLTHPSTMRTWLSLPAHTQKDDEAWNFVFGQAMLMDSIGVFSFARYDPTGHFALQWEGEPDGSNYCMATTGSVPMSEQDASQMLRRACKVMARDQVCI